MPRPPPRPLCLPDLVSNPQTRADFVLANPPKYGPSSSRSSSYSDSPYARAPPSPTSTNADSHRTSGATLASLASPGTPTSSRTSLSVHNLPWNGDAPKSPTTGSGLLSMSGNSSEGKAWSLGSLGGAGAQATRQKPRGSWSSAFVNTKSWFGGAVTAEPAEASSSTSSQKEIKLSPSMIAASASAQSISNRPLSSPYPSVSEVPILSPTCSVDTTRPPKVGTGLRYYSERNPAPMHVRIQIPDPIDIQSHDPSHSSPPLPRHASTPISTFSNSEKELPLVPDVTVCVPSPTLHLTALKDADMIRGENPGPLSPPLTPPVHERENNVPDIRVSSGEDDL
ncbi:hypothetical protein JB92DRAFT_2825375 [Gautieria morchelliformis]|nr:hypothetical protein JB92DRAFT_2825375 [Gautieria morchelliformis]